MYSSRGGGSGRFKRGGYRGGGNSGGGRFRKTKTITASSLLATDGTSGEERFESLRLANDIDERMGFPRFEAGPKKVGWLVNMKSVSL